MKADIITIGDEILIGQILDTNSRWIAGELNDTGFEVRRIVSISDNAEEIKNTLTDSLKDVEIVLFTGGLGPTKDDVTKQTLCDFFDTSLIYDENIFKNVQRIVGVEKANLTLNKQQALIPENCIVFNNDVGTAPVMWFEKEGKVVVSMPGVPSEMENAMKKHIIPQLKITFPTKQILHKTVIEVGYGESQLATIIADWEDKLPKALHLAYLPSVGMVKLRLSAFAEKNEQVGDVMEQQLITLREILGNRIVAEEDVEIEYVLGDKLKKHGLTVATAESCTGGNIAHLITTVPGSSDYFSGSVVAYSNEVKQHVLGVSPAVLEKHGAVSQPVVEKMAQSIAELMGTDIGISTSGIAGPTGGSLEKPVGSVWVGVYYKGEIFSRFFELGTFRVRNITRASIVAMTMVIELINEFN